MQSGQARRNRRCDGEERQFVEIGPQLAPDEPLSPELVLVLPAELRARVLASLGPPVWPAARARVLPSPPVLEAPPAVDKPLARHVGALVGARFAQLALIFAIVTFATLAMSLVAHAVR